MERIVGMGECIVSDNEDDIITTYALASCVAVTAYCPVKKVAGMIHVVLPFPLKSMDFKNRPCYFAQTGIPLLINTLCQKYGCAKEELAIHMYGGMEATRQRDIFQVGKSNIDAVKYMLLEMGLKIRKADLRGNDSRTLSMDVKTGLVEVYRQTMPV